MTYRLIVFASAIALCVACNPSLSGGGQEPETPAPRADGDAPPAASNRNAPSVALHATRDVCSLVAPKDVVAALGVELAPPQADADSDELLSICRYATPDGVETVRLQVARAPEAVEPALALAMNAISRQPGFTVTWVDVGGARSACVRSNQGTALSVPRGRVMLDIFVHRNPDACASVAALARVALPRLQ